jgi:hypothetical protein
MLQARMILLAAVLPWGRLPPLRPATDRTRAPQPAIRWWPRPEATAGNRSPPSLATSCRKAAWPMRPGRCRAMARSTTRRRCTPAQGQVAPDRDWPGLDCIIDEHDTALEKPAGLSGIERIAYILFTKQSAFCHPHRHTRLADGLISIKRGTQHHRRAAVTKRQIEHRTGTTKGEPT